MNYEVVFKYGKYHYVRNVTHTDGRIVPFEWELASDNKYYADKEAYEINFDVSCIFNKIRISDKDRNRHYKNIEKIFKEYRLAKRKGMTIDQMRFDKSLSSV